MKYMLVLLTFLLFHGCGSGEKSHISLSPDSAGSHPETLQAQNDIDQQVVKAFFGDEEFNRVVVVDVDHMKLLAENLYTDHLKTHTADKVVGKPKVYVVNRGSDAIDVVDTRTFDLTKTIALAHHPRSAEAMNKAYGLCAVSGMDKPMVSIIDTMTDEVVATVGDDIVTYPVQTHGGKHACGHPFWLDKDHFVLLDRARREITTYTIYWDYLTQTWKTRKLNTIKTSSSIHQIIPSKGNYKGPKNIFYATAEGTDEVYPSVVKLILTQKGLFTVDEVFLRSDTLPPAKMSIHHGDFHPFLPFIYVGSSDGTLFIINYAEGDLVVEKKLQVGKGAGHTVMIKKKGLGIVINHKDKFVSAIDLRTNRKIKDIFVSDASDDLVGQVSLQAHPKYFVSKDSRFMYAFLTYEGAMYKLDLQDLKVVDRLEIGGKIEQGSFVGPVKSISNGTDKIDLRDYLPKSNIVVKKIPFTFAFKEFGKIESEYLNVEVDPDLISYKNFLFAFGILPDKIKFYQLGSTNIDENTVIYSDRYIKPGYNTFFRSDMNFLTNGMIALTFVQKLHSFNIAGIPFRGDFIHLRYYSYNIKTSYDYSMLTMNMYLQKDKGLAAIVFSTTESQDQECIAQKTIDKRAECVKKVHLGWYFR